MRSETYVGHRGDSADDDERDVLDRTSLPGTHNNKQPHEKTDTPSSCPMLVFMHVMYTQSNFIVPYILLLLVFS